MKGKLKEYIDSVFADAPDCCRVRELKEEMLGNLLEKYDDLMREGRSEAEAYSISVASVGDVSELVDSIKDEQLGFASDTGSREEGKNQFEAEPRYTAEEREQIKRYRIRSDVMNTIAIALYVTCWVPLVLLSSLAEILGGSETLWETVGLAAMLAFIAIATGLMILKSCQKPSCLREKVEDRSTARKSVDDDDEDDEDASKRKHPVLSVITKVLWALTIIGYLLLGFILGLWHPCWLIFFIAVALENVIEAVFELAGKKYVD